MTRIEMKANDDHNDIIDDVGEDFQGLARAYLVGRLADLCHVLHARRITIDVVPLRDQANGVTITKNNNEYTIKYLVKVVLDKSREDWT